jgi:hypothetical protein
MLGKIFEKFKDKPKFENEFRDKASVFFVEVIKCEAFEFSNMHPKFKIRNCDNLIQEIEFFIESNQEDLTKNMIEILFAIRDRTEIILQQLCKRNKYLLNSFVIPSGKTYKDNLVEFRSKILPADDIKK